MVKLMVLWSNKAIIVSLFAAAFAMVLPVCSAAPRLTVWCWDYPQDLRFLQKDEAEVAYYAGTAVIKGDHVFFRPRTKKLELSSGVVAYPVLRIECDGGKADAQIYKQLGHILSSIQLSRAARTVQLDFDATLEDRPFYRGLLTYLRDRNCLTPGTKVQITALASWCAGDSWLEPGLYDERIAMLFSMGADGSRVLHEFERHGETCIGLSYGEPGVVAELRRKNYLSGVKKIFAFSPRPWTRKSWDHMKSEVLE